MDKTAEQSNHTPQDNATLFKELHKLETILFKAHRIDAWHYDPSDTFYQKGYLDSTLQALRRLHLETYVAGFNAGNKRLLDKERIEKEVVKDIEDIVHVQNCLPDGDCVLFWWNLQDEPAFHEACKWAITKQL